MDLQILDFIVASIVLLLFLFLSHVMPLGVMQDIGEELENNIENREYLKATVIHINDKGGEADVYGRTDPNEMGNIIPICRDGEDLEEIKNENPDSEYSICLKPHLSPSENPATSDNYGATHGYDFGYVITVDASEVPFSIGGDQTTFEETSYYRIVDYPSGGS